MLRDIRTAVRTGHIAVRKAVSKAGAVRSVAAYSAAVFALVAYFFFFYWIRKQYPLAGSYLIISAEGLFGGKPRRGAVDYLGFPVPRNTGLGVGVLNILLFLFGFRL